MLHRRSTRSRKASRERSIPWALSHDVRVYSSSLDVAQYRVTSRADLSALSWRERAMALARAMYSHVSMKVMALSIYMHSVATVHGAATPPRLRSAACLMPRALLMRSSISLSVTDAVAVRAYFGMSMSNGVIEDNAAAAADIAAGSRQPGDISIPGPA
eukprot:364570-Chlamydomonas_euryale.AAC.3